MEKIEVVALSHFSDSRIGSVSRKQRLFVPVNVAEDLHSIGLVEYPNGKATQQRKPQIGLLADGGAVLPALSPAAQVLQPKTVIQFQGQDGQQLPSMTVIEEPCLQTQSMPAMNNGGEFMKKKRGRPSKANDGLKITAQQKNMESIA